MGTKDVNISDIEVLFSKADIETKLEDLAVEIETLKFDDLLVIPILSGSFIFAGGSSKGTS